MSVLYGVTLTFRFVTVSMLYGVTYCHVDFQVRHAIYAAQCYVRHVDFQVRQDVCAIRGHVLSR